MNTNDRNLQRKNIFVIGESPATSWLL